MLNPVETRIKWKMQKWLHLVLLFLLQDIATVMYKVKNGLAPASIAELFGTSDDTYFLRNSDFIISRYNTVCYGKHSIRFLGPCIWTTLMLNIRESPTL